MSKKQKRLLRRILSAAAITAILHFIPAEGWVRFSLYMIPYLLIGYDILADAASGILNRQLFDENFLMATATLGAIALALTGGGDYTEAVAVMLFYQTGELFQSIAVGKSRKSIAELMDIRPEQAAVEKDGALFRVPPEQVPVGSIIAVAPGERVPIDGEIIEGTSRLDTSALTGESMPRTAAAGDAVASGCVNLSGLIRLRTTRLYADSTVAKILELVESASSRKSRMDKFITRFARVYTPAVCISAAALALVPPAVRALFMSLPPNWGTWVYRALTFLVISCPCALVISVPLTFFSGIGAASRAGVLIKGSNYLEALAKLDIAVFDKTGTLTRGSFEISSPVSPEALELAAHAEYAGSHPIGRAILRAYGKPPDMTRVTQLREIAGQGVVCNVDGAEVAVGNHRLMEALDITCTALGGTCVYVARDRRLIGSFSFEDMAKDSAAEAISELRRAGVSTVAMLTGDSRDAAMGVAEKLGITRVYSSLLPADKVRITEELMGEKRPKTTLAFVGDGINDAPVLSRADVGIAMGGIGSDAAIEAADAVIMDDDPRKIAKAVRISRKCMRIVMQNIVFALGVKLICMVLGAVGISNMWLAIFADVGVSMIAIINATRAMKL